jgi:hypothetical protein
MRENIPGEELKKMIGQDFIFACNDDEWFSTFTQQINELIEEDFPKLVFILYRLDVSEVKLKQLLKDYPNLNAGKVIAELIIERQLQKINTREIFHQDNTEIDENDKW